MIRRITVSYDYPSPYAIEETITFIFASCGNFWSTL